MAVAPLLVPIIGWIFREIVVKFAVFAAVFLLVEFLAPMAIGFLGPFLGSEGLDSAFGGLPAGVWFFVDFFALGYGLPLIISAYVARFLIRRLPVIG